MKPTCIVILSGGQDSTTALAWAKTKFVEVHAITFFYAQRHIRELAAARKVAEVLGVNSHEFINIGDNILVGTSPLIDKSVPVPKYKDIDSMPLGVEPTFVPGRNLLFLTIAANRAYSLGIQDVVLGVCQVDSGGYYDTKDIFINQATEAIRLGVFGENSDFIIHAPLLDLSKKQIVLLSKSLGILPMMKYTHTCYKNSFPPCGFCHACLLRERGFMEAGVIDPLIEQKNDPLNSIKNSALSFI